MSAGKEVAKWHCSKRKNRKKTTSKAEKKEARKSLFFNAKSKV